MADDTRQQQQPQQHNGDTTDKAFRGDQWTTAAPSYKPPENANLMPGGTEHTAGGKTVDIGLVDAAKSIKREDWTTFHRKPCVKDSYLTGIGAGAAVGSVRAVWRAPIMTSCNYAVSAFCISSFAMYQYCQYQRRAEKEGMKRAIEIIDRKGLERKQKEARMERARELRRQKKEEEEQAVYAKLNADKEAAGKSWWKVW
ncbi:hypothetical protein AAFC00_006748 [Neodothiora populina]|uniref:Cytochrome c oxidase assembly protein COX20, mitochondrial n=1 Tax=Neodothiora populina TaxID=2781224 RepID=A0ABR3PCC4_9PEZI